ncbi:MAG: hypothetical protein LW817_07545 [Candidatus Caenarcaniphilales bacterium]|nr:hypothetical protein [Candidatus Caenarcaniphilales bacterium]
MLNRLSKSNEPPEIGFAKARSLYKQAERLTLDTRSIHQAPRLALDSEQKKILLGITDKYRDHFRTLAEPMARAQFIVDKYAAMKEWHPAIKQFVRDAQAVLAGKPEDYSRTRSVSALTKANFVLGVFKIPYNNRIGETPSLECITFERCPLPSQLSNVIKDSKAVSIIDLRSTHGFGNPVDNVALFGENYLTQAENENDTNAEAFYFIEKFANRTNKFTIPVINQFTSNDSFKRLKDVNDQGLMFAHSAWLNMHEHNHASGPLPRVDRGEMNGSAAKHGYYMSNTKYTGALEELRVDLETILSAFTSTSNQRSRKTFGTQGDLAMGDLVGQLILAERLIRYPIQLEDPAKISFDAISSHILINHLLEDGAIKITNGQMQLDQDKVEQSLKGLHEQIEAKEKDIISRFDLDDTSQRKTARNELVEFAKGLASKHCPGEELSLHPFYVNVRKNI